MAKKTKTFRHSLHQPPGIYLLIGIGAVLLAVAFASFTGIAKAGDVSRSPAACTAGASANCRNALADGGSNAVINAPNKTNVSTYYRYGFSINNNTNRIDGVAVLLDGTASDANTVFWVSVSNDNGRTWGPEHETAGNANGQVNIDVTGDKVWTGTRLGNSYFRVRVKCVRTVSDGRTSNCRLDWLPVRVLYNVKG